MRQNTVWASLALLLTTAVAHAQDESRLLRFPTIHGDQIVFSHAGDLFTASASGGIARRLTSQEGTETFPRLSPDGKWIAFTGQYDGNTEVYVIPAEGGSPRRLTYTATLQRDDVSDRMGPNNLVIGWKHDSKTILFRSRMRSFNDFIGQLFTVTLDGGLPEPLPLPRGGFASYSADDSKLAYNQIFREFRTWKRYRGGMADDISIYDFKTKATEKIAISPASDIIPMWHGDKIYFVSDRDENVRMNLFSYDTKTKDVKQVTHFKDFDVKFPSLGDKAIVFENGGFIHKLDLSNDQTAKVSIQIRDDFPAARTNLKNVSTNVGTFTVSPDGKRGAFSARGDVFTVPVAAGGITRNLTKSPGAHDRDIQWSPDGKHIAVISDATGEDEIHLIPADGSGTMTALTTGGDAYKYNLRYSPDGKKILWHDRKQRLQVVDVATRQVSLVAQSPAFEITQYAWSPDSRWIAYVAPEPRAFGRIWIYSVEEKKALPVTDGWHSASFPAFSGDGKYLFFVSARDFSPTYSQTEWNHAYTNMERVYMMTLQKETRSPFEPKSDEQAEAPKPAEKPKDKDKDKDKKDSNIRIDFEGIADRVLRLNVPPGNYGGLESVGSSVYYFRTGGLHMFDVAANRETAIGQITGYEISADQKKMIVSQSGKYGIIDLPKAAVNIGDGLNLSGLEVQLDHGQEWRQIFVECWRQMRDFFYDPGLHGVDWAAIRKKYEPLVAHVHHRIDLTYVIGEMIGELNAGHAYVGGGEMPSATRTAMGLLGAELKKDAMTGFYQIAHILKGAAWDPALRSPLAELGVNVKQGEFIVAVNGKPVNDMPNLFAALVNTAGKQVVLMINSKPAMDGARAVTVVPIADESRLYYHEWVHSNIEKVSKATKGEVGYLHVPDMLVTGLNEFTKYYYPQIGKKALIVDMRGNGGGNVSPMLIERLRRELAMVGIARNSMPTTQPTATFLGPKVCLLNEFSASDGDLFPWQFKHYGLGKLIGKRSWGGVVGIRGTLPLLDGGSLNRPEFSRYDIAGKEWIIEGHGVDPDIVVDNDPAKEFAGVDQQLNKAIEHILEELKTKGKTLPPPPPYPKR
jgi:tricorn protease